jgi:UTP:GlnB (protein PII) uridylyltransferase
MIRFAWSVIDDFRFQIQVRTPVTRIGTLHRLTAAIYVLGMDIVSGNVLTEEEPETGDPYSHDNFVLRIARPEYFNFPMHEISSRLGVLMETILQKDADPAGLLAEHGVAPPDPAWLFSGQHSIRFTQAASGQMTRMHVESEDRTGLLYHITQALARENINVWSAVVLTTESGTTEDSFYLQSEGTALSEDRCRSLEIAIKAH